MSLKEAIKNGTYKNYYATNKDDEEDKKKKTLKESIQDGTYKNYFSSTTPKKQDNILPTATSKREKMSLPVFTSNLFLSGATKNKANNENRWEKIFKAGEFEDGYQFGDVTKTVLGTGANLVGNVSAGIMTPFENVLDIGTNLIASGLDTGSGALGIKNEKVAKNLREFANKDLSGSAGKAVGNLNPFGVAYNIVNGTPEKIINPYEIEYDKNKSFLENYANGMTKSLDRVSNVEDYEKSSVSGEYLNEIERQVGYTVGLMMGGKLGNTSTKVVGNSKLGASLSTGNIGVNIAGKTLNLPTLAVAGGMAGGLQEANEKGDSVTELERWSKGISGGFIEGISEGLFGMFGVGGNEITNEFAKKIADKFSSSASKTLAKIGVNATGEAIEEFLSYAGNFLIDNGIINKLGNTDFSTEWNWEELGKQLALAFASSAITTGGGTVIQRNTAIKVAEEQLGRKLTDSEKSQVTQAVIEEAVQESLNAIANTQDMLYTNNESEGEINDQRGIYQDAGRMSSILQQDSKSQQAQKYTKQEYSKWQQSIKPTAYSELTTEQKQLKNDIKRQYGKDIVFFDGNENDYNGGSSLNDSSTIYVNRNNVEQFGITKIAFHEVMESNIRHNINLSNDIIRPAIETIMNDDNFQIQKNEFWSNQDVDIPSDYMIAKDILCDRFSELKSGESLDYENILSQETNMTIDFAIENFENSLNANQSQTTSNLQQNIGNNQFNSQGQQITPQEIKNVQNQNMEQADTLPVVNKEFANNQYMLYTNTESESEINERERGNNTTRVQEGTLGSQKENAFSFDRYKQEETAIRPTTEGGESLNDQIQQSRMLGNNTKLSRISEKINNKEGREYSRTEFEQWEQSIRPTAYSELTTEQKQLKNDIKRQYGKNIVFFDGQNNKNSYSAGASYNDSDRINIDINQAKEFGLTKMIYHEVMESNILHNIETNKDIIEPAIQKIMEDANFEQQKNIFWQNQNESMPKDYLIAKEILCDRFAEIKTGEKWDYNNILSQETNMTIDFAIENFENSLKVNQAQTASNLQQNIANNQFNSQTQQITPQETKNVQNQNMEQIDNNEQLRIDSENFSKQIDDYVSGKMKTSEFISIGKTPQILQSLGVPNNDIVLKQNKLKTIMQESSNPNDNFHGLSIETIKRIPNSLASPLNVLQSSTNPNSIVVITDLADKLERPIIASIEMNYKGQIGNVDFLSNRLTSAYGKNNYDEFMQKEIKKGNLLYDIDEGIIKELAHTKVQFLESPSSLLDTNVSYIDNSIPQNKNLVKSDTTINRYSMQNSENNTWQNYNSNTNQQQKNTSEDGKNRKHYKSIYESDQVGEEGRKKAKEFYTTDRYTPISNIDTISKANETIESNGVDNTYSYFKTKMNNNEKVTLQDITLGERLIQIYSYNGDTAKLNDVIQDVAILGTELGQQVQALSLIKRASPEGQLLYLQKVVARTNTKMNTKLKVSEEMADKILKSKNQQELDNIMTDIAVELGEQLPVSMKDKVRSWRYLSMLGNPKTHIKNIGANVFMNITQQVKNKVAGSIEDVAGVFNKDLEKTKTLKFANKEQRNFAKQDADYMKDKIDGGGKYDIKNLIQNNKRQFDNKLLNSIAQFNSNMLELEDNIFLKRAYQQSMQNYMSANNLSSADMKDSSVLQKAREYASYQAQEATFHQFNSLAQRLTELENKGGISGKAVEAVLPFKKTPMNIAKSGIEYSPIGLAKSLTYDIVNLNQKTKDYQAKLENGTITKAEYKSGVSQLVTKTIDNTAKGLTGTSLAVVGYALANMGILKAGNDGEDDEFKEKEGEQEYSIRIGDCTYSLDWIAPSAIPMFIGATVHDLIHSSNEDETNNILNSFATASAKAFEPMTEMSMLQGITSAISSYEQGSSNMLFDLAASAVSSYAGQFVPTALGQIAKMIDPVERDTSSTEKGIAKKLDQFARQQIAKTPFLSQILPARKDVWGNDKMRDSNILARAYEVGFSPYNRKKIVEDATDRELLSVFDKSGENVLPSTPSKSLTINTKKYELTSSEYNEAKGKFGKTSKSMLDSLTRSTQYKQMSYEKKAEAIESVYSYAKEQLKMDYAKKHNLEYEETTLSKTVNAIKSFGGNASNYFEFLALTKDLNKNKDKIKVLSNSGFSMATKETIYKNSIGKQDNDYAIMEEVFKLENNGLNINDYLNFKQQEFEADKEDDDTLAGKSISGSKKKKVYDYVYSIEGASYRQKTILYALECKPSSRSDQQIVVNFIEELSNKTSEEEITGIIKRFQSLNIYKNGTFSYKN